MPWRVIAASVRGTSHVKFGQECQDTHCWRDLGGGVVAAAVADGAGSAGLSAAGAAAAVRGGVEAIAALLDPFAPPRGAQAWGPVLEAAVSAARDTVVALAADLNVSARELATTLILVVASPDQVAAAQVGDGASLVRDLDGNVIAVTRPPDDEFINQTSFLTDEDALAAAQMNLWEGPPAHIAVLTDGLQMLALRMPDGIPYGPFFQPLFRFVADSANCSEAAALLQSFLRSPRISERADDDLTLLLATLIP